MNLMTGCVTGRKVGRFSGELMVDPQPLLIHIASRLRMLERNAPQDREDVDSPLQAQWRELALGDESYPTFTRRLTRWQRETPMVRLAMIEDMLTGSPWNLFEIGYDGAAEQLEERCSGLDVEGPPA